MKDYLSLHAVRLEEHRLLVATPKKNVILKWPSYHIINIHVHHKKYLSLTLGMGGPPSEAVLDLGPRLR